MNDDVRRPATAVRLAALVITLGMLSGCLRPWAEPAPETIVRPAPPPVVTMVKDESPEVPRPIVQTALPVQPEMAGPRVVTVAEDDTLYRIAWREDVALQSLVEANNLQSPFVVVPGQELTVPSLPEYEVKPDDTLYAISRCAGVDVAELARTNHIDDPFVISPGQRLRIPARTSTPDCRDGNTVIAAPAKSETGAVHLAAVQRPTAKPTVTKAVHTVAVPSKPVRIAEPPTRAASRFLWPVDGEIVSKFGPKQGARQNNGINIAAAPGTPVRASENGVVVYAGNELRGYGNLLLVRHADGWTSAYAHNGELLVERGTVVERGQIIAKVGNTGSVTSPQSHFELRKGAKAVDPLKYLSPR